MAPTNIVTHELESHGVRTFSAKEMVFNILRAGEGGSTVAGQIPTGWEAGHYGIPEVIIALE